MVTPWRRGVTLCFSPVPWTVHLKSSLKTFFLPAQTSLQFPIFSSSSNCFLSTQFWNSFFTPFFLKCFSIGLLQVTFCPVMPLFHVHIYLPLFICFTVKLFLTGFFSVWICRWSVLSINMDVANPLLHCTTLGFTNSSAVSPEQLAITHLHGSWAHQDLGSALWHWSTWVSLHAITPFQESFHSQWIHPNSSAC